MMVRRSESGFYIRAGLSGSACDSQTPTSLGGCPFSSGCRSDRNSPRSSRNVKPGLFETKQCNAGSFMVRNLTQKRRKIFHLNCVPRQFYRNTSASFKSHNIEIGRAHV